MEYIAHIGTQYEAPERIIRTDGIIVTFNHRTETDENEAVNHICSGWLMTENELIAVQNGTAPQYDEQLHLMFRTYQHQRADNEYAYAQRMYRSTNDSRWNDYIRQLDSWNAQISATRDSLTTYIPDMPQRPN